MVRTGEWSEQTYLVEWNSDARGVGAAFTGHNRTAVREWTTVSTVVTDVPGEEFSWSVGDAEVLWGYRIRSAPEGSVLTEFTRFGPRSEEVFERRFPGGASAQIEIRRQAAIDGLPRTLARIAALVAPEDR